MILHVFPILIPPPTSLSTLSLWVFPVHQARALASCIQPGLVICFTLNNIHVLMGVKICPFLPSCPLANFLILLFILLISHTFILSELYFISSNLLIQFACFLSFCIYVNPFVGFILIQHPTLAFSHRVQKSVLYICVSFSVLHIGLSLPSF